ncbi:hypothetical protein ES703_124744 [subsurface metagenome]
MVIEAQILSSLSPNVVVGEPVGPSVRNQRKNLRSFDYFLCKTNPIKANLPDAQMSVTSILTKDYERNDIFAVPENKPNSNPINRLPAPKKTNPNKPNFTYPQRGKTEVRCRMSEVRYLASVHGRE